MCGTRSFAVTSTADSATTRPTSYTYRCSACCAKTPVRTRTDQETNGDEGVIVCATAVCVWCFSVSLRLVLAPGPSSALLLAELDLPQPHVLRGDLGALVFSDELERL